MCSPGTPPQTRRNEASGQVSEIKKNNFVFQPIATINAPKVQELIQLIDSESHGCSPYGRSKAHPA